MDPDIDIMKRQMAEEVKEKYTLYEKIRILNERVDDLQRRNTILERRCNELTAKVNIPSY
tara:strand:- start:1088 stop:1267 length:180 start_codon:yes stop_codon:yes gene_type:complete